ncbi:MAG: amino acid ABC transporter permease [Anaerolineae bacterium]
MATLSEKHPGNLRGTVITQDDSHPRQPPLLVVGPLAWVKKNLFNTVFDSILTIVVSIVAIGLVSSFVSWTVTQANWYAINFNLSLLALGRYEDTAQWRVTLVVLLTAATIGLALAAWARVRRRLVIVLAVLIALTFIVPAVINATLALPPFYMSAGAVHVGGDNGPSPDANVAFVGRAGEIVTFQFATQYAISDRELAGLHSFTDNTANAALNAAANRLTAEQRIAEIEALLAGDTLTDNQRSRVEGEESRITVIDPVTESLKLNQAAVKITILNGDTQTPIEGGEVTLEQTSEPFSVTLPNDGWYILQKEVAAKDSLALIEVIGVYPVLERTLVAGANAGNSAAGTLSEYVRMTDLYTTQAELPRSETGRQFPFTGIITNQYRGTSTLNDFLRLYVAPFLNQINVFFLVVVVAGAVGYFAGRAIDRYASPPEQPHRTTGRIALWLLIITPVLAFVLIYGVTPSDGFLPVTDTSRWGGILLTVLLTVVGIIGSLPLGILLALGRRSKAPVISTVCTIYIEVIRGIPFITVLFMAQLLIPLINPELSAFPGAFRAMIATVLFTAAYNAEVVRGGLQAIPGGQEEAAKALGLSGIQITLFITLPQALRLVIPPMMGNFVGMFKDTSLVGQVGLIDLLGMAQNVYAQTEFLGLRRELFAFVVIFYFVVSYAIAAVSRRIEASGSGRALKMQI